MKYKLMKMETPEGETLYYIKYKSFLPFWNTLGDIGGGYYRVWDDLEKAQKYFTFLVNQEETKKAKHTVLREYNE